MLRSTIHPTAIVEPGVRLGDNVVIEAYAVVKSPVTLKDNVVVKSHAYIDGNTTIGSGTVIWPFASIGSQAQDLRDPGKNTRVKIGENCQIREYVTINSSCGDDSEVVVGDNCFIMAYCHIAHNCKLGNRVVMSNNATLAGHVTVEDHVLIGGMTPVHQFARIGAYSMVGGVSVVLRDIPPYTIGCGVRPYRFGGLNMIGLKRHGFPLETRQVLSRAFKLVYRSGLHLAEALEKIKNELPRTSEVAHWLEFCQNSKRGLEGIGVDEVASTLEESDIIEELAIGAS